MRATNDVRLFFALWPDQALRARLQQAADAIPLAAPARRVPAANLHLTLHFIGNVSLDDMACMRRQAARVSAESFELRLDRQGCFDKAKVAWLGCSEVPAALTALHGQLGNRLQHCGFEAEARTYNPHVTVARKVAALDPATAFAPLHWRVRAFALVSVHAVANGVQYRIVESWPLR